MPARISICDDDPVVGEMLERELRGAGFDVQEPLSSVGQAMGWLTLDAPDVLVLDLNMPAGEGLDLLGWMGAQRLLERTRVLMLTGEGEDWYIERARQLGASGYLTKPALPGRVTAKVLRLLDDPGVRWVDDFTTLSIPPLAAPANASAGVGALNPVLAQMVRAYGEPSVLALLRSLLTQLDAFPGTPKDPADLERGAHAVRGAAATMGFAAVADACAELERSCRSGRGVETPFRGACEACGQAARDVRACLPEAA